MLEEIFKCPLIFLFTTFLQWFSLQAMSLLQSIHGHGAVVWDSEIGIEQRRVVTTSSTPHLPPPSPAQD